MEEENGLGFIRDVIMERSIIVCSTPRVLLRLRIGPTRDPDATRKVLSVGAFPFVEDRLGVDSANENGRLAGSIHSSLLGELHIFKYRGLNKPFPCIEQVI